MNLSTRKTFLQNSQQHPPNPPNFTLEAGLILQKLHHTLANNYDFQMPNNNLPTQQQPQKIIPENGKSWIDTVIDMEMTNMQNAYQQEENQYVEKMLIENPPVVSVRRNPRESEVKDLLQQQKAESCRRSRLNGKIKKAKTRFRHQFITEKISKSANMLRCVYEVIEHAENKLIQGGFDRKALEELKRGLGMNTNISKLIDFESNIDNNNSNIMNNLNVIKN